MKSENNIPPNNIRKLRRDKGMSMEALALELGITAPTINKIEKSQMRLTDKYLSSIANALGVSISALLNETPSEDTAASQKAMPVYGLAAASIRGAFTMTTDPVEWVTAPPALTGVRDAYALIVTGNSMEPRYYAGDIVFINPNRPARLGDHVVIQEALNGGIAASIKRFEKQTETELITTQYNPLTVIRFKRDLITAVHRVLTSNELLNL